MDDQTIIDQINDLTHEEQALFEKESHGDATRPDQERLKRIQVMLDQCWDLLHQRRARRNAGLNPDEAAVRDESIVEGYVD